MELYKIRDIVRENVGYDAVSEAALTWAMERGLREIEKERNWYWMEARKDFSLVVDQGDYNMYTSTSGGLNIPAFKDARILLVSDQTLSHPDWDEVFGPEDIEEVKLAFADDDDGMPVVWTKQEDNTELVLSVWPPDPDKTYSMKLYYYQWTSLPTDPTSDTIGTSHEVTKRWPEALIYLATEQAMIIKTKDLAAGSFWRALWKNPNPRVSNDEFHKMLRFDNERSRATRTEIIPRPGGLMSRRRRWRRNREIWI